MKLIRSLFLCLLLSACLYTLAAAETTTVMLYMCGTDIQEDALTDLKEMCSVKTGSNIRIVVLAGGTKDWTDSRLKDKKLNLFTIQNGSWSGVTDWGSSSMGSTDTLRRFVTYCWNNCRSDRNMLIMWDHGSTALDGLCFDEVYNDDGLTLSELGSVFLKLASELNGFHLDVIGSDACLMASYEMAATLAPYADYYVASEELEPWLGWYYTNWLNDLNSKPSMTNQELAVSIVDSYIYGCNRDNPNDYLTLSAIDLSVMNELRGYIDSLASTLTKQISSGQLNTVSRTVQSMYRFGSYDDAGSDMVDLSNFLTMCESYDPATAQKAKAAYSKAVVYNYANKYVPGATGLSIYIPVETKNDVRKYLSAYTSSATTGYAAFVSAFAGSVSSGNWSFSSGNSGPYQLDNSCYSDSFVNSANAWYGGCYGYGSGYGYNTSGIVIAGSAGQNAGAAAWTQIASSGTDIGGIIIAGTVLTPAPVATTAPAVTATAVPVATPAVTVSIQQTTQVPVMPTQNSAAAVPNALSGSYAFSITLSEEDMHYLAYAELLLYQDFSDENGWDLDEMGRVRDTWIDWEHNTVYAVFDGTWPVIDNLYAVMYEQSRTDYGRRCIIPVMLNDKTKTYLVVEYSGNDTVGRIIGTSDGWGANGLPVRGLTPLSEGDIINPIYPNYYSSDVSVKPIISNMSYSTVVYYDKDYTITWDGTQTVTNVELPESSEYKLAFRLHDIFGGSTTTDFITFSIK